MSASGWPLRLVEWCPERNLVREGDGPWRAAKVGDCWLAPWMRYSGLLGEKYRSRHAGSRAPIYIQLPADCVWCPDRRAWSEAAGFHGDGWDVQGDPPNLTITPSINFVGTYHGWVTNGVITPDCEGRHFDAEGRSR